jgi:hypothetical protein
LGEGVVLDPFAGPGSTLAAAVAVGYRTIGIERDWTFFDLACTAVPRLAALELREPARDGQAEARQIQFVRKRAIPSACKLGVRVPTSPRGLRRKSAVATCPRQISVKVGGRRSRAGSVALSTA